MSNTSSDTWYVDFRNNTTSTSVGLTVENTSIYTEPVLDNTIYCALESWYDNNPLCYLYDYDMPGDTTFTNICVELDGDDVDIDWDEVISGNSSFWNLTGRDVDISGNTITLHTAN